MLIQNNIEKEKIIKSLNSFFNLEVYTNYLFLTFDEFIAKYNHFGFSFQDFFSIRFENEPGIIQEICHLLPEADYYIITLQKNGNEFYKLPKHKIKTFLDHNPSPDFIILELRLTWLMVYDQHRKLFGLGNYIKKKLQQNINTRFGNTKIMFSNSDT